MKILVTHNQSLHSGSQKRRIFAKNEKKSSLSLAKELGVMFPRQQ